MKPRIIHIVLVFVICCKISSAQDMDFGFTLTPLTVNKITFDKPAVILNEFYSYDIGKESPSLGYPTLLGFLSSGIYLRYNTRRFYLKAEANYQTKSFRYTHKSVQFSKYFFYYSCFELPVVAGVKLNPENIWKFKVQAGLNFEYGKFNHNSFVSPFYALGLNINENKALLEMLQPFICHLHIGAGADIYGISLDLRFEKNISGLNKSLSDYNANFVSVYTLRLVTGFKISGKHWDKYRKNKPELRKENV